MLVKRRLGPEICRIGWLKYAEGKDWIEVAAEVGQVAADASEKEKKRAGDRVRNRWETSRQELKKSVLTTKDA